MYTHIYTHTVFPRLERGVFIILMLGGGLFEGALRSREHSIELKPTTKQSIHLKFHLLAQPFYMACNWTCVIALLKLTSQLFTTSPQSLHNLCCTHHNLCCTSLLDLITRPHHDLCCTSPWIPPSPQIRPHHDLYCTSPQTSLYPQILNWPIETRHPVHKPAVQNNTTIADTGSNNLQCFQLSQATF